MGLLFDVAYAAAATVTSPIWAVSLARTGKWRTDWRGKFGKTSDESLKHNAGKPRLLFHAVSVGEVNAIRNLVNHLADDTLDIVIATTTDTGYARACDLFATQHTVVRYPFDFSCAVKRLLDAVQPTAVALVELEVWPNFVQACHKRGIPICVVNGRLSARSFSRYRLVQPILRSTFGKLHAVAAQTSDYAKRFVAMGTPQDRVHVLDTMKWDTATLADHVEEADALGKEMGIDPSRPLVVAGSTGPGEERFIVDTIREHCDTQTQIMLVPRRPERFDEVASIFPGIRRRTQCKIHPDEVNSTHLFLLDTMGELRKAYALADIVVVGRSFVPMGGSDPIEPIALGKPTVIGPHVQNFSDVVEALSSGQGLIVTNQLAQTVHDLLHDPKQSQQLAQAGRAVIRTRQGATERHAALLRDVLHTAS